MKRLYETLCALALRWARVAPAPDAPMGAPDSVRIFRAGKNYLYLRLVRWGFTQIGAVLGILFSIGFVSTFDAGARALYTARTLAPRPATPSPSPTPSQKSEAATGSDQAARAAASPQPTRTPRSASPSRRERDRAGRERMFLAIQRMPPWVLSVVVNWIVPLLRFFEYLGIATFVLLLPLTYVMARIEYDQHWYVVTDRSLRIRTGLLSLSESTMSFANLQQVEIKQGPVQRLLGLADIQVRSAGGGDGTKEPGHESLHTGTFKSVDNAEEIRDLIVDRLRRFREAGLGDARTPAADRGRAELSGHGLHHEVLSAARAVLEETRALRHASARQTPEQART